jgi:hypothetical protein
MGQYVYVLRAFLFLAGSALLALMVCKLRWPDLGGEPESRWFVVYLLWVSFVLLGASVWNP